MLFALSFGPPTTLEANLAPFHFSNFMLVGLGLPERLLLSQVQIAWNFVVRL